jgi:uncharacterized membrane protein
MNANALVEQYLSRLETASQALSGRRRAELLAEVRDHISAALAETGSVDEATVRNLLDRLGDPEEIVAAEEANPERVPPIGFAAAGTAAAGTSAGTSASARFGVVEGLALLLLVVGPWIIPFIGAVLGLIFVWASSRWQQREKAIATAIVLCGPLASIVALVFARAGS